jgi:hypothetical protein
VLSRQMLRADACRQSLPMWKSAPSPTCFRACWQMHREKASKYNLQRCQINMYIVLTLDLDDGRHIATACTVYGMSAWPLKRAGYLGWKHSAGEMSIVQCWSISLRCIHHLWVGRDTVQDKLRDRRATHGTTGWCIMFSVERH